MDLDALLTALQTTQQKTSSVRLSERNVVELLAKLKQLGLFGDELLHTINGKEYITTERLKADVRAALQQAGGRVGLAELPALVGVDLAHCERQAAAVVAESGGAVIEAQGELLTVQYFDALAAEVDDLLQEAGVLSLTDLALSYSLNTELLLTILGPRIGAGRAVNGHREGGLLYTPAYVRSIKARLRGALRGVCAPASLPALAKALGLEALAVGGGGGMLPSLVEELAGEGALKGGLRPGGTTWVPAVHTAAQAAAVRSFYQQNGWVGYDVVQRAGISNDRAYLRSAFPEGLALESAFVSPGLLAQVDSAVEEAVASASWVDVAPLLPSALGAGDVADLLGRCALLKEPERGAKQAEATKHAEVIASTCVVSAPCLAALKERAEAAAAAAAEAALRDRRAAPAAASSGAAAAASKKPGSAAKAAAQAGDDDDDDDWSMGGGKKGGKKGGKSAPKGKASKAGGGGGGAKGGAAGGKQKGGGGEAVSNALDAGALAALVVQVFPDMEDAGEDGALQSALAERLRPATVAAYEAALAAALNAGAEERRRLKEALARGLDESHLRLQLYARGAELLEEDEATYSTVQRHVLRSAGGEALDCLLRWARLEFEGAELDPADKALLAAVAAAGERAGAAAAAAAALPPPERSRILKALPSDVGGPLASALDSLNGTSAKDADAALEAAVQACGLRARRLDKKAEKAALAAQRALLGDALALETAPASALSLAVPLLFLNVTGRLASVPGRAIGGVLQRLQRDLPEAGYQLAQAFHSDVVEALKASSGGDADGAARAALLGERLAEKLPLLKALAASPPKGGGGAAGGGGGV